MTSTSAEAVECPFCVIVRGDRSATEVICEAPTWIAFFPTEPATPGHTLVIPRLHVPDAWALQPELASELANAVIRVGKAIRAAVEPEGMNLISSSGVAAEQTVFHVHFHVVPRWHRDGIGRIWPPKERMLEAIKEDLADAIRAQCLALG